MRMTPRDHITTQITPKYTDITRTNTCDIPPDMKNQFRMTRNSSVIIPLLQLLMCIIGCRSDLFSFFTTCSVDKCIDLNLTTDHHAWDSVRVFALSTTHRVSSQSLRVLFFSSASSGLSLFPLLRSSPTPSASFRSMPNLSAIVVLLLTSLFVYTKSSEIYQ